MSDIVERLRVKGGSLGEDAAVEIVNLTATVLHERSNKLYWEGRWRNEAAEIERLRGEIESWKALVADYERRALEQKP